MTRRSRITNIRIFEPIDNPSQQLFNLDTTIPLVKGYRFDAAVLQRVRGAGL